LYSSSNINIWRIKLRRVRLKSYVVSLPGNRSAYRILEETPEGESPIEGPRRRREGKY
jgi:hypothetical protein